MFNPRILRKIFLAGAALFLAFSLFGNLPTAHAATLCVAPGGAGGCYATITAAVTAASSGDTITVAAGVYSEGNIVINKSITLLGDPGDANPGPGPDAPVLDGSFLTYGDAFLLSNGVSNVTIRGFEIRNYATDISSNGIGNGISAWVTSTSHITVQDNYFHDLGWNAILVGNDGAKGDHTYWTVKANVLERWAAYGFELTNTSNSLIEDNRIIADTTYAPAISILVTARRNETGITIRGNQISGATNSLYPFIYVYAYDIETPNVNLDNLVIEDNYITATNSGSTPYYHVYIRDINTGTVTNAHVNNNVLLYLRARTVATVDAEYNWWGNDNGPYDPNDEAGETTEVPPCDGVSGLEMINTDGTTGLVAGNADYCPWTILPLAATASSPVDGAVLTAGINQLTITFNNDVKHDGSSVAADNVINYLLFEAGENTVFDTVNCLGGVVTDDTNIVINSATYNPATFTATLNINNGVVLPNGQYRLLACGTTSIEDLDGNKLNGGLSDSATDFTITVAAATDAAAVPDTGFAPDRVTVLPEQTVAYTQSDLWLEIPKLGVKMDIVGVPQADGEWDVSWLGNNAGWLDGTAFPTWNGNSVITGHVWNADNTVGPFGYINTLWYGDQVIVHAWGADYVYEVRSVQQVGPGSTAQMLKHEELPWVTLVTCRGYDEATGTYKYRVLVRAVLVDVK